MGEAYQRGWDQAQLSPGLTESGIGPSVGPSPRRLGAARLIKNARPGRQACRGAAHFSSRGYMPAASGIVCIRGNGPPSRKGGSLLSKNSKKSVGLSKT